MAIETPMQTAPDSAMAAVVTPPERADEIFLEGPRSRFAEFCTLLRIMRDFLRGYRALHFVGPCVTVFGSARIKPDDPHYELALKMGAAIARLGFTVMTGGGPGIMEAANRGAKEVGGRSVGSADEEVLGAQRGAMRQIKDELVWRPGHGLSLATGTAAPSTVAPLPL